MLLRQIDLDCEIRATDGDSGRVITGYAAMFNKMSQDLGGFRELILPGAFAESIEKNDVRALWSHNIDMPLGRTSNGSLKLEENTRGLKFTLNLPDTQIGRDAFTYISRGDVKGMSFGFNLLPDGYEWQYKEDNSIQLVLKRVHLLEVSPTAFPAYEQTEVWARSNRAESERLINEAKDFALKNVKPSEPKFHFARERLRLSLRRIGQK